MRYAGKSRTCKEESMVKSATLIGWIFLLLQAKAAFANLEPTIMQNIYMAHIGRP